MLRIFLPLYIILITFISSFYIAVQYVPGMWLATKTANINEELTKGTFFLIDEKLKFIPEQRQHQVMSNLQSKFAYPIQFLEESNSLIGPEVWTDIQHGKVHTENIDKAEYIIKKLPQSEQVVAIAFSEENSEAKHREAQGTYKLLIDYLAGFSQDNWMDGFHQIQSRFGVPLTLKQSNHISLTPEQAALFNNGKIVFLENSHDFSYIGKVPNSIYAFVVGPVALPISIPMLITVVLASLIVLLALAVYFWVKPLSSSINTISQAADAFGNGQLSARASVNTKATLGKLSGQFNLMAKRIEKLVAGHRDLTNAISHELRTPISRMRFASEIMRESIDSHNTNRFVAEIDSNIVELETLIDELLTYARFEHTVTVDTKELVPWFEEVIQESDISIGEINLDMQVVNVPKNYQFQFNHHYMKRAIDNILINARRYAKNTIKVTLGLAQESNSITITIEDDGIGIPQSEWETIFEPFSRLDDSRNKSTGGYGLGLAIAKKIVAVHNGEIDVSRSVHLGGACFSIHLPIPNLKKINLSNPQRNLGSV